MKKLFISCIATVILLSTIAVVSYPVQASSAIKTLIFKGTLFINNHAVQTNQESQLLSYNNKVYIPLRDLSGQLGLSVGYDSKNQSIYIDQPVVKLTKSSINKKVSNEYFELGIFSEKRIYAEGEPINIWSHLSYTGHQSLDIFHDDLLIKYLIRDSDGFEAFDFTGLSLVTSTFNEGDEFTTAISPNKFTSYNLQKNEFQDFNEFFRKIPRPSILTKGNYVITAYVDYSLSTEFNVDNRRKMRADINITIE
ncbi:stalk domain-containing protein [Cohnella abietis]|uniref:Copper amine oxidase-like N-terminal domain-containing protein n=1 Tax=Cohnella abietis TaxID=2507935 RepID=A0A3T1D7M4_9BACL|nr:stalk domain-containing protein [Cohnella abietis]BBI34074.1 hypothetical protein KCTCHS21_34730 [Cohnella abietis]